MRFVRPILLLSAILLGLFSGLLKMMEIPQDVVFFGKAGLSPAAIGMLGAIQLIAALLMIFSRTRIAAGIILAATFAYASWLILDDRQLVLGLLSTLLVAGTLAASVWRKPGH